MAAKKKAPRATKKLKTAAKDDKRKYSARIEVDFGRYETLTPGTNLMRLGREMNRLQAEGRTEYGFAVNACKHVFGLGLNVLSDLKKMGVWKFVE